MVADVAIRTVVEVCHSLPTRAVVYLAGGASLVPSQHCSRGIAEKMALLANNRGLKVIRFLVWVLPVHWQPFVQKAWGSQNLRSREEVDKVSSCLLIQAMAKACRVSGAVDSGLTESEVPDESEILFSEEQEIEQLIKEQICYEVYPFSSEAYGSAEDRR